MPELTEAAQKNLAAGKTDGAGTDTCRKCGGPKEERRLNSGRCAACDGKADTKSKGDSSVPARDDTDRALAWMVKSRLVLPPGVPATRRSVLAWARENGFEG